MSHVCALWDDHAPRPEDSTSLNLPSHGIRQPSIFKLTSVRFRRAHASPAALVGKQVFLFSIERWLPHLAHRRPFRPPAFHNSVQFLPVYVYSLDRIYYAHVIQFFQAIGPPPAHRIHDFYPVPPLSLKSPRRRFSCLTRSCGSLVILFNRSVDWSSTAALTTASATVEHHRLCPRDMPTLPQTSLFA